MAKFCGYCGSRLDEATGLCPHCNAAQIQRIKASQAGRASAPQPGASWKSQAAGEQASQAGANRAASAADAHKRVHTAPATNTRKRRHAAPMAILIAVIMVLAIAAGGTVLYKTQFSPLSRQLSLGQKYLLEEDYEQAVIAFNKVIELDPKSVNAYEGLLDAYLGMDDVDAAYNTYMTVQAMDDADDEAVNTLPEYRDRIETALQERVAAIDDVDEQIRLMEMLSALCPDNATYGETLEALRAPQEEADDTSAVDSEVLDADAAEENAPIYAQLNEDGTAYILLPGGNRIDIAGSVAIAAITADREHIVVSLTDGTLYVTDMEQSDQTVIANSVELNDMEVRDSGFLYWDTDSIGHRVLYEDGEVYDLPDVDYSVLAPHSMTMLCRYADGIYILTDGSTDRTKVDGNTSADLVAVSDDGERALITLQVTGGYRVMLWSNGEVADTVLYDETYGMRVTGDLHTVAIPTTQGLDILTPGHMSHHPMDGYTFQEMVYTEEGPLEDVDAYGHFTGSGRSAENDYLYLATSAVEYHEYSREEDNNALDIHCVDPENDTVILSDIWSYNIANNHIYYTDMDRTLYAATLENGTLSDVHEVADGVGSWYLSTGGTYIYYYDNVEDVYADSAALYCYRYGDDAPILLAEHAGLADVEGCDALLLSEDGASVAFLKNMNGIQNPDAFFMGYKGALMIWTYGDEEAAHIADDVVLESISTIGRSCVMVPDTQNYGFTYCGAFDPAGFEYQTFVRMEEGEEFSYNLLYDTWYYDGAESSLIASDVS